MTKDTVEEARQAALGALADPPEDEDGTILEYIQEAMWGDLMDAIRYSANGVWSIRCDSVVHRIVWLTKHTEKPTPWDRVQIDLLLDGTYEAIHEAIGMPTPLSAKNRAEAQAIRDSWTQR